MKPPFVHFSSICFLCAFFFTSFFSCTHEPELAGIEPVCYDTQVLPILQTSCGIAGCHDGTDDDFAITDYQSVMQTVKPGDPHGSLLYKVITDIHGENFMPPDRPLTQVQRNIIQIWIAQGAHETTCKQDTSDRDVEKIRIWINQGVQNN